MSQEIAAEDRRTQSGTVCKESTLYKCTNGNFEIIQFIEAGQAFPNAPFGDAKGITSWQKVTRATDGSRKTFDGSRSLS
jgi:hypothetical protein